MTLSTPDYHSQEEFQNRLQKLEEIRALAVDPYPYHFIPTATTEALKEKYKDHSPGDSEQATRGETEKVVVAGRIVLFRAMGKNAFAQIQDHRGRIQVMFNRDLTKVKGLEGDITPIKFIEKKLDLGDIIGIEGFLFRTHVGELTILATTVTLLSKALLPLPDKHSGLADKGVRYRKRWLDLITDPEVVSRFRVRSHILRIIRTFLEKKGFLEVETATLQNTYGGAAARPFKTHLHALDQEMFLRISLEIPLKKLIVGGMNRVFELGKVFRNEGIDRTHNPEFTELELYAAYFDYNDLMLLLEELFETIALELFGTTKILFREEKEGTELVIDVKSPWKRLSMKESINIYAGIDVDQKSDEELKRLLRDTPLKKEDVQKASRGQLIAYLFEEFVEEHLIQPHHIIDHPIETTPLCKPHRDPVKRKEGLIERFESFILGGEYSNAYTELNDPVLQRTLLEEQVLKKESGDEEAHPMDEEFIEAMSQGMPPTGGLGLGIDRLVMFFTSSHSIRDVIYFPLMRPED